VCFGADGGFGVAGLDRCGGSGEGVGLLDLDEDGDGWGGKKVSSAAYSDSSNVTNKF
jgi:hypothetical protein